MYNGVDYSDESYFLSDFLSSTPLICKHSDEVEGDGEALLPNGNICDNTSNPIQCININDHSNGNTIAFRRVGTFYPSHELQYTCCLPHSCSNSSTYRITANIYRKYIIHYQERMRKSM